MEHWAWSRAVLGFGRESYLGLFAEPFDQCFAEHRCGVPIPLGTGLRSKVIPASTIIRLVGP